MQEYIISLVLVLLAYYAIKNVFSGSKTLEGFVTLLAVPVSLYCITGTYFYVGLKMGLPDWLGGLFFFPCALRNDARNMRKLGSKIIVVNQSHTHLDDRS